MHLNSHTLASQLIQKSSFNANTFVAICNSVYLTDIYFQFPVLGTLYIMLVKQCGRNFNMFSKSKPAEPKKRAIQTLIGNKKFMISKSNLKKSTKSDSRTEGFVSRYYYKKRKSTS